MLSAPVPPNFDPNAPGDINGNLFGLPFNYDDSLVAILPVPWDVTTSYNPGTHAGPDALRNASLQIDLYDPDAPDFWQHGIYMLPTPANWLEKNAELRPLAEQVINALSQGKTIGDDINLMHHLAAINDNSHALNDWVYAQTAQCLCDGKITGLVGGEHSTPLGFIRALSEIHNEFGILHIDAHADLRHAYEGFTYSHASIMYNALQYPQITRLVSVGLRDVCDEEMERIADSNGRIRAFFDRDLKNQIYIERKRTWADQCKKMISKLPKKVYISFDIDGLDPSLCPNTGTPVPGGLSFHEAVYLLHSLVKSGKQIIGFDLCEVSPSHDGTNEWDANVGARILYKLCNFAIEARQQYIRKMSKRST